MLLGKRRQPKGKLGEIDSHFVLVHTIQTALGYHATGMKQFLDDKSYRPGLGPFRRVENA